MGSKLYWLIPLPHLYVGYIILILNVGRLPSLETWTHYSQIIVVYLKVIYYFQESKIKILLDSKVV